MTRSSIGVHGVGVADLSPDQREAYDAIVKWADEAIDSDGYFEKPVLSLGGFAGVGKTCLTALVAPRYHPVAFATLTGKASSVLRGKLPMPLRANAYKSEDLPEHEDDVVSYCGTIHSLCYKPIIVADQIVGFERREELDAPYKLICIDEGSCVNDDMLLDLRGYGVPILLIGDHGQLPPVDGFNSMMANPDLRLEKIHRQAEGNPIIALSKAIREGTAFAQQFEAVRFLRPSQLEGEMKKRYSGSPDVTRLVTITHTNRRRIGLNMQARRFLNRSGPPAVGDQVLCLRNVRGRPVYNGMRGLVASTEGKDPRGPWRYRAGVDFEGGEKFAATMCGLQFSREKTFDELLQAEDAIAQMMKRTVKLRSWEEVGHLFDWGYALTAFKAQGSSFDDVLAVDEVTPWMTSDTKRRALYSMVTRAVSKLTLVRP